MSSERRPELDLPRLLDGLAEDWPVFHSEANFQHALAWTIQTHRPGASIRLETRPERGILRLHEGRIIHGDLAWHERTGGTSKGREAVLPIRGRYECRWETYSTINRGAGQTVEFRRLALPVTAGSSPT